MLFNTGAKIQIFGYMVIRLHGYFFRRGIFKILVAYNPKKNFFLPCHIKKKVSLRLGIVDIVHCVKSIEKRINLRIN